MYVNNNNEGWVLDENPPSSMDESIYRFQAQALESLETADNAKMNETGDNYEFTYTGDDESVYEAFGMSSTLDLDGLEPINDNEIDVFISIRKDDLAIDEISWELIYEDDEKAVEGIVTATFDNINEIDEIEVPGEVVEEAR